MDAQEKSSRNDGKVIAKPRKFRLRNNAVVEEWPSDDMFECNGYINEYKIISFGDIGEDEIERFKEKQRESLLCLVLLMSGNMPTGGAYGKAFDIVEEITETEIMVKNKTHEAWQHDREFFDKEKFLKIKAALQRIQIEHDLDNNLDALVMLLVVKRVI